MDIWIPLLKTRLEAPEFEFSADFIGGRIIIQKDFLDEDDGPSTSSGWLIHAYFQPIEFKDRPIMADICFRYGTRRREICSVFLQNETFFGHVRCNENKGRLIVAAKLRKMLCGLDLQKPSNSRQFIVQNFESKIKDSLIYYVNIETLDYWGGDLIKKWKAQKNSGVMTVNENMEDQMIDALMESVAKYSDLVIMRNTIDRLILIARKFRMHKLMRAIEDKICETKLMSWDEKILLALQYRMSPLYISVQRKYLLSPWTILCRVQRLLISTYLRKGEEPSTDPYEMMHKHLLELIMLSEENICIG